MVKYSEVSKEEEEKEEYLLNDCSRLTNAIVDGLDLRVEIKSVIKQQLGDVVLIWDLDSDNNPANNNNKNLAGFAICHWARELRLVVTHAMSNSLQSSHLDQMMMFYYQRITLRD